MSIWIAIIFSRGHIHNGSTSNITYKCGQYARVFALVRLFQPSLMFACKTRSLS